MLMFVYVNLLVFSLIGMLRLFPGAMLHLHDISMLSAEALVANVTYMEHLYLCNSTQVSARNNLFYDSRVDFRL